MNDNEFNEDLSTEESTTADTSEEVKVDPLEAAFAAAMEKHNADDAPSSDEDKPIAEDDEDKQGDEEGVVTHDVQHTAPEDGFAIPEHWPAEQKEALSKIKDAEARNLVLDIDKRLQAAHTKRSQEHADKVKRADALEQIFSPHKATLQQQGLDEISAINALMQERTQFMTNMQQNPKETIRNLATQYGVDLTTIDDEDDYKDPYVVQLEQKLKNVEGQFQQFTGSLQQQQAQQYQQQINQFAEAKNEDGSLKHQHFDVLRGRMAALMQNGYASTLEDAYSQAMRSDPELGNQFIRQQTEAQRKAEEETRRAEVEKAKRAKRKLSGRGVPNRVAVSKPSIDEAFNMAMDKYRQ